MQTQLEKQKQIYDPKYMEAHLNPTQLSGYIPLLFPEVVQRNCTTHGQDLGEC